MTASDLEEMMVRRLVRTAGGTQRRWRIALGRIRVHAVATHPHCNWSAEPNGSPGEVAGIERLVDQLKHDHPIVTAG